MNNPQPQPIVPALGMNRDAHPIRLKAGEYSLAKNIGIENESGNGIPMVQNEPSNILCYQFPKDYHIIGNKFEASINKTIVFLTNPITGLSEIGYILQSEESFDEIEGIVKDCNCDPIIDVGSSLESSTPINTCKYERIISDCTENKCLKFNINRPIKSENITFKKEQCGLSVYWTDGTNPRVLNLDEVVEKDWKLNRYLHLGVATCQEDKDKVLTQTCLDCAELKIFKDFNTPCIGVEKVYYGGNLAEGSYEFVIALCDEEGNEVTQYYSHTLPVFVFDRDDVTVGEGINGRITNFAIELSVNNLDEKYGFYKIGLIYRSALDEGQRQFIIDVFPDSQSRVLVTDLSKKIEVPLSKFTTKKINYDSVSKLTSANGYMFMGGLSVKPTLNLQPVVNLLGPYLNWQTYIAQDSFYKDMVHASLRKSFMRDEVYPLSIQFTLQDGTETNDFILINRSPYTSTEYQSLGFSNEKDDLEVVATSRDVNGVKTLIAKDSSDKNIRSILMSQPTCTDTTRIYHWQYYNTAKNKGARGTFSEAVDKNDPNVNKVTTLSTCRGTNLGLDQNQSPINIISNFKLRVQGQVNLNDGSLSDFINNQLNILQDSTSSYFNPQINTLLDINRYTGRGCYFEQKEQNKNCDFTYDPTNNTSHKEEIYIDSVELTEGGVPKFEYLDIQNYKYSLYTYEDSQTGGVIIGDKKISTPLGIAPFQLQTKLETKGGEECIKPLKILLSEEISITGESGLNLGNRASKIESELINPLYTTGTIPDVSEGYRDMKFINSNWLVDGLPSYVIVQSFYKLIYVKQSFKPQISINSKFIKLKSSTTHPVLQLNFISKKTTIDEQYSEDFTLDNDITVNRIGKVRVSIFKNCNQGDTPKQAIFTKFYGESETPLLDLRPIIGGDLNSDYYLVFDTPVQKIEVVDKRLFSICSNQFGASAEDIKAATGTGKVNPITVVNKDANGYIISTQQFVFLWETRVYPLITFAIGENTVQFTPNDKGIWEVPNYAFYNDNRTIAFTTTVPKKSVLAVQRPLEYVWTEYDIKKLVIGKKITFSKTCYFKDVSSSICEYGRYEYGLFGYNESSQNYPDNEYLYKTNITESQLQESILKNFGTNDPSVQNLSFKEIFKINFGTPTKLIAPERVDFRCKPIRHFKFPDNTISPFVNKTEVQGFQDSIIHPLGITIDKRVVNTFLDLAVASNLITQKQRDSIISFKLKRGDRTLNESVLSKGILTDLILYRDIDQSHYYSNFPFNSFQRKELLQQQGGGNPHQNGGNSNSKFTFLSPETATMGGLNPTEIKIDGFQYGVGRRQVNEVLKHPKMVLLTNEAYSTAYDLAFAEVTFEHLIKGSEAAISGVEAFYITLGLSGVGGNIVGAGIKIVQTALVVAGLIANFNRQVAELEYKWLEIFKNGGKGANFAHYITSVGHYNNFKSTAKDSRDLIRGVDKFRYLKDGTYRIIDKNGGITNINNIDREYSTYIDLGKTYDLSYDNSFKTIDVSNSEPGTSKNFQEETFGVAGLYGSLKLYLPSQYGRISDINWINISQCNDLKIKKGEDVEVDVFGGDVYISRFTFKKKFNYYLVSNFGQADFTPFKYSQYYNVPKTKYFIDYETEPVRMKGRGLLPYSASNFRLYDQKENGYYIVGGRFYHYENSFSSILVESKINCYNRLAHKEPHRNFYPNFPDFMEFTQQDFVSIRFQEEFTYNSVYTYPGLAFKSNFLPNIYDPKSHNCLNNSPSGIIYSEQDNSEKRRVDPWLVYKPLNFFNFKASYGKFISLKPIESQILLAFFENRVLLLNKLDELRERITPENKELGTGMMFSQRPIEFQSSDLGYGGTQHNMIVSTEFGHFWADMRRGHVFMMGPNGQGQKEITKGLRNWFVQHLPFKILKSGIEGLSDLDVDTAHNGLGLTMGWDARFKRLFLTKLDYTLNSQFKGLIEYVDISSKDDITPLKIFRWKSNLKEVGFKDEVNGVKVFNPTHFTLAYSPQTDTWISYYDFTPNFYISYNNFFSTGYSGGIWNHLKTDKSYTVFYGKKYGWSIEYPTTEQYLNKQISNVNFWIDSIRYHNKYDFSQNTDLGIDRLCIFNNTNNSGWLKLEKMLENNMFQNTKFPKQVSNIEMAVLASYDEGSWRVNDFFNRVKNENNNIPIWRNDLNHIDKTIEPVSLNYNQRWLDRIKGDYFTIRIESGSDSRYKQIFKWMKVNDNLLINT